MRTVLSFLIASDSGNVSVKCKKKKIEYFRLTILHGHSETPAGQKGALFDREVGFPKLCWSLVWGAGEFLRPEGIAKVCTAD